MKFRDLTPGQVKAISNGCGGKGSKVPVPEFMFTASCDHHDFNYWIGGTEYDRWKADWQFYLAMVQDTFQIPWWRRPFYRFMAWVYYKAVRTFAKPYFHYGPQRGRAELEALLSSDQSLSSK